MINIKFSNQASTTLVDPILSTASKIVVEDASVFPMIAADEYFIVCVTSSSAGYEIMKVVGVEDNTLTVVRAQEGTSVKDFPSGASVENRLTAGSLNSVIENASETVPHAREDSTSIGQGSEELFGHVKITDSDTSEATSTLGIGVSPYAMKRAFDKILGASTETILTTSGTFKVPVTGTYTVTTIGGGGAGGNGGRGGFGFSTTSIMISDICAYAGGGGGGGGAGQTVVKNIALVKDASIPYIIGGPSGTTTFGSYATALGGGKGNNGGNATIADLPWMCSNHNNLQWGSVGTGGSAGTSYGSSSIAGASGSQSAITAYQAPTSVGNASGGNAGITADGVYGNGGRGGDGAGAYIKHCLEYSNPAGGTGIPGTQGCIKIRLAVG